MKKRECPPGAARGRALFEIFSQTDHCIIDASPDGTIMDALLDAKIKHVHVCNGKARCTTCRVSILKGLCNCLPRNESEQIIADKLGFPDEIRLACQTGISGNISIRRPVVDDMDIEIILNQSTDTTGTKLGQEKALAILFTDIENYTPFAEALPAYDVVHILNRYYRTMNEIIMSNHGIISDVAGDGILALFGMNDQSQNPVLDAITTVRSMNKALVAFNRYLRQLYNGSFGIRAGINFGKAVVGNFETGMMGKIAAIGDSVNLASRIENANKRVHTKLLISHSAYEKIKGVVKTDKKYRVRLKGKSGIHVALWGCRLTQATFSNYNKNCCNFMIIL